MVVIAYYYYAESASAEFLTPTRGSVWFLPGVIAAVSPPKESNMLCVRPSRRTTAQDNAQVTGDMDWEKKMNKMI